MADPRPGALVTGASSGIGLAFARALARSGHDLVLVARDPVRLTSVAEQLGHLAAGAGHPDVRIETLPADLATTEGCDRVRDRLRSAPVDVLVNNAGFGTGHGVLHAEPGAELRLLDVLTRAVLVVTEAGLEGMRARDRGTVITVASVAAFLPGGSYTAAKAWAVAFTRGLAHELAGTGVRATVLCPGFVRTDFHRRAGLDLGGVPGFLWLDADRLVRDCLDDVARGRVVSIPTRRYRLLVALLRHVPLRVADAWILARRRRRARRAGP